MTIVPREDVVVAMASAPTDRLRSFIRSIRTSPWNAALTAVVAVLVLKAALAVLFWAVIDAAWGTSASACAASGGKGACWAVIGAKARYILFGAYPFDAQWRPALGIALFVGAMVASCVPMFWGRRLLLAWAGVIAAFFLVLSGGVPGLTYVAPEAWGGLPLTLALSIVGVLAAFPLGVGLALGRRSPIPSLRTACTVYVEVIRGVPLITVLFMSSVLLPLLLPDGLVIGGLARAMIAIVLFTAAYVAEVIRGGLQALPKGQVEAAASLGLGYWRTTILIVLPQALRIVIPPLVNTFIEVFKDTTLVIIVGLFDLLNTTRAAILDIEWRPYYAEAYLFAALIYFFFCFLMSRISLLLEHRMAKATRR